MDTKLQSEKASLLHQLHQGPKILILVNAWDAASARVIESLGYPAVATTSGGVARSLGYPDGEHIPRGEMIDWVARIVRSVRVPVTADLEAGYGRTPEAVAETARLAIGAGAVGMNFEDSIGEDPSRLVPLSLQAEKIQAIRETADALGVQLVLNARTDVYLTGVGEPSGRFGETVKRLNAYREAGAGCLFAPGVADASTIAALVREVNGPLNVLATDATPPVAELEKMGVRRLSLGSGPSRAALAVMRRIHRELKERGTCTTFTEDVMTGAEADGLFVERDHN